MDIEFNEQRSEQRTPTHLQLVVFLDDVDPEHPVRLLLLQVANVLRDVDDLDLRHLQPQLIQRTNQYNLEEREREPSSGVPSWRAGAAAASLRPARRSRARPARTPGTGCRGCPPASRPSSARSPPRRDSGARPRARRPGAGPRRASPSARCFSHSFGLGASGTSLAAGDLWKRCARGG
jgi:hypothetical protein